MRTHAGVVKQRLYTASVWAIVVGLRLLLEGLEPWAAIVLLIGAGLLGAGLLAPGTRPRTRSRLQLEEPTLPEGVQTPARRSFQVDFPKDLGWYLDARVSLTVHGAPDLLLERAARVSAITAFFERRAASATGDPAFDARFRLEGARVDREARKALEAIFDEFRASRIESRDGRLTATVPLERLAMAESYTVLLRYLDAAAPAIERVAVDVKVLGGQRKALVGGEHGAARCSYCHGEITGSEPDLVACGECSTVLHEGCWAELGRCPVLGCTSKTPERARVG